MSYFTPPTVSKTPPKPPHDLSINTVQKPGPRTDKQMSDKASSIGDWVRSKLPSHRPERGGTKRDHGYWEKVDGRRRRVTDSQQSRRSETGDSDLITRWNTPKDLPDTWSSTAGFPRRAFSSIMPKKTKTSSNEDPRRVSWVAPVDGKAKLPVEPVTASETESDLNLDLAKDKDLISLAADRRLSLARKEIEAKKELHRRRRHLKESGDYLGVQGINPDTGQLDVITPTDSGNSSASQETTQKINAVRQALRNAKSNYQEKAKRSEREIQQIILGKEKQRMKKSQQEKDEINRLNQGLLKWRRHTRQWSSAQEPDLSPIAQSHRSGASTTKRLSLPTEGSNDEALLDEFDFQSEVQPTTLPIDHGDLINETSGRTSRSVGTVIHTPHRRRMANQLPEAQQSSKDDAGFTISDNGQGNDATQLKPRLNQTPSPDLTGTKTDPTEDTTASRGSFLGIRSLGGRSTKEKNLPQGEKVLGKRRKVEFLLSLRKRLDIPSPKKLEVIVEGHTTGSEPSEERSPPRVEQKTVPNATKQKIPGKDKTSDQGSFPKRASNNREVWDTELASVQAVNHQEAGQTNLKTGPTVKQRNTLRMTETRRNEFLQEKIQREVDNLKLNIAKLDVTRRNASNSAATDHSWIEDVMRDITKKGEEVKEQPASIHTTTITGCGPQTSGSGRNEGNYVKERVVQETQKRILEYPTPITNSPTWRLSQQNLTSSTLLRLDMGSTPIQIDTTSMMDTAPAARTPLRSSSAAVKARASRQRKKGRLGKSPTYTSTSIHPITPLSQTSPQERVDHKADETSLVEDHLAQALVLADVHGRGTTALTKVREEGARPHRDSRVEEPQVNPWVNDDLLDVMKSYPGTYPCPQQGEEHIVVEDIDVRSLVPFSSTARELPLRQCLWDLWEALKAVGHTAKVVLQLYIRFIRPVYDNSSDHWRRAAIHQNTLEDCAAAWLALPPMILAIFVMT